MSDATPNKHIQNEAYQKIDKGSNSSLNGLLPCSLCGGTLHLYFHDDTDSTFCDGSPCWDGGATCEQCGVGFSIGTFGGGIEVSWAEKYIIKTLNRRAR